MRRILTLILSCLLVMAWGWACTKETTTTVKKKKKAATTGIIIVEEEEDPAPVTPTDPEDPGTGEQPGTDPETPVTPDPEPVDNHWFQTRGVILTWEDVMTLDWIALAKTCGINTFSVNNFPSVGGSAWKDYKKQCADNHIKLCYEDHMGSQLIPRSLFNKHPEYFRMNESGQRVDDVNFCVTNPDVQQRVYENAVELAKAYAPTNHRHYYWGDDFGKKCYCPNCNKYTSAEQWLIVENIIIDAIRTVDPDAMLAHLIYDNTMESAPKLVTPKEGIFLQFAPINRRWDRSIADASARHGSNQTHGYMTNCLKEHLKIFPVETAEVLEYWLDVTMSSSWKKPVQRIKQWYPSVYQQDIAYYASLGIRHIVTYGMWIGGEYFDAYRDIQFVKDYGNGLLNYTK